MLMILGSHKGFKKWWHVIGYGFLTDGSTVLQRLSWKEGEWTHSCQEAPRNPEGRCWQWGDEGWRSGTGLDGSSVLQPHSLCSSPLLSEKETNIISGGKGKLSQVNMCVAHHVRHCVNHQRGSNEDNGVWDDTPGQVLSGLHSATFCISHFLNLRHFSIPHLYCKEVLKMSQKKKKIPVVQVGEVYLAHTLF